MSSVPSPKPERSPPTEEQVRRALIGFSELIRQLEAEGRLAREVPTVMRYLGDLRQMLFDYEVRVTERLLPTDDPQERQSRWIVREAKERSEDSNEDWGPGANPPDSD